MELILLRHAPPHREFHRRYIGHTDIVIDPDLFDPAKVAPLLDEQYDAVCSSDLVRCTATLRHMGMEDYITDSRLREVRFKASVEGKSFDEIAQTAEYHPGVLASVRSWHDFVCDEPSAAFSERVASFLGSLPPCGTVLVCTHAGTIREILSQLFPEGENTSLGYLEYTRVRVK